MMSSKIYFQSAFLVNPPVSWSVHLLKFVDSARLAPTDLVFACSAKQLTTAASGRIVAYSIAHSKAHYVHQACRGGHTCAPSGSPGVHDCQRAAERSASGACFGPARQHSGCLSLLPETYCCRFACGARTSASQAPSSGTSVSLTYTYSVASFRSMRTHTAESRLPRSEIQRLPEEAHEHQPEERPHPLQISVQDPVAHCARYAATQDCPGPGCSGAAESFRGHPGAVRQGFGPTVLKSWLRTAQSS